MNSLVLKPWRWVVFLAVIPGTAPCSGLRPSLATGAPRRTEPREACEVRRAGLADGFLARRPMPDEPFLDFERIFPATAYACRSTPLHGFIWGLTPKNKAPRGERSGATPCETSYSTFSLRIKVLLHCKITNGRFAAGKALSLV